jgi:hypothetical protein
LILVTGLEFDSRFTILVNFIFSVIPYFFFALRYWLLAYNRILTACNYSYF